ncbi:MAG: amidohydrolase [Candidatus Heimdallarchaeaceae archaeon]
MRNHLSIICFILICASPFTASGSTLQQVSPTIVDYIYCNSNIISVDDVNSIFEAIAIKDGLIVALGSNEDILSNYEAINNQCYNLEGRTIMPGIIDGHSHYMASLFWIGETEMIYDAQSIALANGYTTLNEKSVDGGELAWLQEAEQNGTLRLRVNAFLIYNYASLDNNKTVLVDHWAPDIVPINNHDRMLRIPGMKIYADGASGNRGFPAMSEPYTQEMIDLWGIVNPYGDLYFNQTELNAIVDSIHDRGFITAFHAMGDRATETVLNSIEYALNGTIDDAARHQLEHNSFIREDLISKSVSLDTIHSVRGYFPTYWQEDYADLYSSEWQERTVNRYSLPGEGLHSYLETDFSFLYGYDEDNWSKSANIRPFLHLWGLVTRKAIDVNGTIHEPDPWVANHTITVEQALRMMTIEGAYAVKQEDYIGSFEVGKYADIIILSADPLTMNPDNLKDIEVMLTMIDGKIEYQIASHSFPLPCNPPTTNPSDTEPTSWFIHLSIIGLTSIASVQIFRRKIMKKK